MKRGDVCIFLCDSGIWTVGSVSHFQRLFRGISVSRGCFSWWVFHNVWGCIGMQIEKISVGLAFKIETFFISWSLTAQWYFLLPEEYHLIQHIFVKCFFKLLSCHFDFLIIMKQKEKERRLSGARWIQHEWRMEMRHISDSVDWFKQMSSNKKEMDNLLGKTAPICCIFTLIHKINHAIVISVWPLSHAIRIRFGYLILPWSWSSLLR